MTDAHMEAREACQAGAAKRLREFRLSFGYKTAASFARDIVYPPGKYSRYERTGFIQGLPLCRLARAIEETLPGALDLDWLFDMNTKWHRPRAKRAFRTVGNVVHVNFAR